MAAPLNEAPTLWSGKFDTAPHVGLGFRPLNEAPTLWSGKSGERAERRSGGRTPQ